MKEFDDNTTGEPSPPPSPGPYEGQEPETPPDVLLPALLFAATVVTTVIFGAFYEGVNPFDDPWSLLRGVPFSAALLLILGTHEFGHYFASRRHGVSTTLPYFIPAPPIPPVMIGTFGAVIKLRSPVYRKGALVDIGAAGPLAGFVVAVVAAVVGLSLSEVRPVPVDGLSLGLGDSIVFSAISYLVNGPIPEGHDVYLGSVAFAAWIGFFITALNLLPIGQLDGGHIIYALVGPVHRRVSFAAIALLVVAGLFTWPGWIVWAVLVTIIGTRHPPVVDEAVPLDGRRRAAAAASFIVFVLTFTPVPFYIY